MFDKSEMLYLYVETPLHAGSGGSIGVVDLPIQRERVTGFPMVQASGIKGKLRSEAYDWDRFVTLRTKNFPEELKWLQKNDQDWATKEDADRKREAERRARKKAAKTLGLEAVFGPESDEADHHSGALSPGDARLLLFPVRSLIGVFAWTTCRTVLSRFKRDLEAAGKGAQAMWTLDNVIDGGTAWTVDDNSVVARRGNSNVVVLEEFRFSATPHTDVGTIANWLATNVLPRSNDYKFFREKLMTSLVILPEDAFRDFTQFGTEIVSRIRIDQEKKTVAQGALWTEELLPSDTVLYAPLHASRPRTSSVPADWNSADNILQFVCNLELDRIQLGGDETVGRGIVKLRFGDRITNAGANPDEEVTTL